MRARSILIVTGSVLAALAALAFAIRGGGEAPAGGELDRPVLLAGTRSVSRAIETAPPAAPFDDDPPGTLRLEGQVIDHEDRPVPGATVVIDANPPREVRTEGDGAFAFDQLTPRAYRVAARAGDANAGPLAVRLGQRTEPVILRIRASGRIAVTVTSDAGKPVPGALVELRDLATLTAITDDAGRVTLRGVGPGWHVIKASADGHASALREISTTGEAEPEVRLELALRAGASAAGAVVDAAGAPIEGARIVPAHAGHLEDLYDGRLDAVITDAKGRWRLTGLPRETLRIRAYHAVYAPGASAPLLLAEGDRTGVTIVLDRGGRVRGRVVDGSGAPAAGVEVRLTADSSQSGQIRRVATDAGGAFELAGLPRRLIYAIAASDGAASKLTSIDLAGPAPAPIVLTLEHAAALAGVVVTSAGTPVPEARVHAEASRSESDLRGVEDRLRGAATAITGTDGRFRIAGLPPGAYLVRAIRPGSSSTLLRARLGTPAQTGTEARIIVDDLSSITGIVAYPGGKPVTRFSIQLGTAPPRWLTPTDGAFRIEEVPAGKQFVRITGPDMVAHSLAEVEIEARRPRDLGTITVQAGRAIAGIVLDRDGRPVTGAAVAIARELRGDGTSMVSYPWPGTIELVTGADGRFTAKGLGSSTYQIAADHEAAGRSPMTAIPPGTADAAITLALEPTAVVQGFVRLDGKPTEAVVGLIGRAVAASSQLIVRSGPDGSYRFDRVAPGHYLHTTWLLRRRSNEISEAKTRALDVPAGGVVNHDVDLTLSGVNVILHLTSPNNAVHFGYGWLVMTDDDRVLTMPPPRSLSEARSMMDKLQAFEARSGEIVDRQQIRLDKVRPGLVFACAVAWRGDPRDPAVIAETAPPFADLPISCKRVVLPGAPDLQHLTIEVQPLPPRK